MEGPRKIHVHFLYFYNEDWIRKHEGMHQEEPGAFSIYLEQGVNTESWRSCQENPSAHLYIYNEDLTRKLGGMHQEEPGAFSIHL